MKDLGLTSFALLQCLTETMICVSGGEQLKVLCEFLDKMEQLQPEAAAAATCPKGQSGMRELYTGSGLYLSPIRLAAILGEARKDCLHLFHLLFEEFFTAEECQNAVAFGKKGKVPQGKRSWTSVKLTGF